MAVMDKDGNIMLVDVKALSLRTKNGWKVNRVPTKEQDKLGVELVFVNLDSKEVLDEVPNARYDDNVINLKWYKLERQIGAGVVTPIDTIVHVGQ